MSNNGFSAADMSTAAANGHAEGYRAGYADAVKAAEVGKPAAAQEAVAYLNSDSSAKRATKQAAPKELWDRKLTRSERQCWAQGFNAATVSSKPTIPQPHQECYSDSDGESWFDDPADSCIVDGMAVGDTYTLQVSHYSVGRTYRVTKAPDETSDDYEVEPVQATSAEVGS